MTKLRAWRSNVAAVGWSVVVAAIVVILTPIIAAATNCAGYQETWQETSTNDSTPYYGIERYISGNSISLNGSYHLLESLVSCQPNGSTQGHITGCTDQSSVGVAIGTLGTGCGTTSSVQIYYEAIDQSSNPYYCHYYGVGPQNPNLYSVRNVGRLPDGAYQYQAYASLIGTYTPVGYAEFTNNNSVQLGVIENEAVYVTTCGSLNSPAYFGTDANGTPQGWSVLLLYYSGAWNWWGAGQSAVVVQSSPYIYTQLNRNGAFKVTGS